jgi:branched-chain amino acid transport system substrate-binding protein
MKNKTIFRIISVLIVTAFFASACSAGSEDTIKIGINAEITGDKPKVGEQCKFAAEMYVKDINDAGGIDVGGKITI